MLGILREYYPEEYSMLVNLAVGNIDEFIEFAEVSPSYTQHLLGYGIISKMNGHYDFKIDSIKNYLSSRNRHVKINLTQEEMFRETEERRNRLEPKLRSIIKTMLRAKYGEFEAKKKILQLFPTEAREKIEVLTVSELLSADTNRFLMFLNLKEIINKQWGDFQYIFDKDQRGFDFRMDRVNTIGRRDAHSRTISAPEMQEYRTSITWLEEKIREYES